MITIINGRRGQGKTTLAYFLSLDDPTRLIFDPRRQFKTSDVVNTDGVGVYELLDEESEILVQPFSEVKTVFTRVTQEFRDWTLENPEEHACFLADEVRFLDTPSESYDAYEQLLRFSDTSRVNLILTSHRPSDIAVDIRAIADYLIFYRTTQEHDLKLIRERCGEEVAEIVSNLEDKEFLVWDDGVAKFRVERDPEKWFVDIHKESVIEANAHGNFL